MARSAGQYRSTQVHKGWQYGPGLKACISPLRDVRNLMQRSWMLARMIVRNRWHVLAAPIAVAAARAMESSVRSTS
jgi:hypothetical protein